MSETPHDSSPESPRDDDAGAAPESRAAEASQPAEALPAEPPSVEQPDADPAAAYVPPPVSEQDVRLAEALLFASAEPVSPRALAQLLSDGADVDATMRDLRGRYVGRGVEVADIGGGWQFRTAADLAPRLRRVIQVPRRLPRAAMETLAIIAYHQPVTRAEIEQIRGATLAQTTLDALLETGLIAPRGRRETPGRPTLWGTTPAFLSQFGLSDLRELPRREDLLVEPPSVLPQASPDAAPEPAAEAAPEPSSEPS